MQPVHMHVDGSGVMWALTKCQMCGEVHKYLATDVVQGEATCRSCSQRISVAGALFDARVPAENDTNHATGKCIEGTRHPTG